MKILCTSVGNDGFPAIMDGLRQRTEIRIVGCDSDSLAPGLILADQGFVVPPRTQAKNLLDTLQQIITNEGISVILPLSTEDQAFFASRKDQIESLGVKLAVSSIASIELANDKHAFYNHCRRNNHLVPEFSIVDDRNDLLILLNNYRKKGQLCVLKQSHGTGSQGVKIVDPALTPNSKFWLRNNIRVSSEEAIRWAYETESLPNIMISDFLPGRHISVDSFRSLDGKFIGIARTEDRHLYGMGTAGIIIDRPDLINTACLLGYELSLTYCYNIEFKADKKGVFHLLEINPRFPASIGHSIAAGLNFPLMAVDEAIKLRQKYNNVPFQFCIFRRYWQGISR